MYLECPLQGDITEQRPTPQSGLRAPSLPSSSILCTCCFFHCLLSLSSCLFLSVNHALHEGNDRYHSSFNLNHKQFTSISRLIDLLKIECGGGGMLERKCLQGRAERQNSTLRLPSTSLLWELKRTWHELGSCFGHWVVADAFLLLHLFLLARLWFQSRLWWTFPGSSDSSSVGIIKIFPSVWAFSDTILEAGLRFLITARQGCKSRYPNWPLLEVGFPWALFSCDISLE